MAVEGLEKFETTLKVVIVENCKIDWKYLCEYSGTKLAIKTVKTVLGRCIALFGGKYKFIFAPDSKNIKSLVKIEGSPNYKGDPILLHNGIPLTDDAIKSNNLEPKKNENILYINYNETIKDEETRFLRNTIPTSKQGFVKRPYSSHAISARNCNLKGIRDCLDSFMTRKENVSLPLTGQKRDFLNNLVVIGQFDRKAIMAMRNCEEYGEVEVWMFDQHACAERINLEELLKSPLKLKFNFSRDEMNMKACRSAIKFGDLLNRTEQENIIKRLEGCDEPFHCAHGRPTCWLLAKIKK